MGIHTDRRPTRRVAAAVLTAALATVLVAGCAGGGRSGSDQPGADVATQSATPQRTSVNDASEPDLTATLRTAGVSGPGNWAQTLIQYRPYPPGEAGTTRIRQILDQYKADPDTVAKVTATVGP